MDQGYMNDKSTHGTKRLFLASALLNIPMETLNFHFEISLESQGCTEISLNPTMRTFQMRHCWFLIQNMELLK